MLSVFESRGLAHKLGFCWWHISYIVVNQSACLQTKEDEELSGALDSLDVSLKENIQLLSSFEKYKKEVLGDSLDWTPMHTSQQVTHCQLMHQNQEHMQSQGFLLHCQRCLAIAAVMPHRYCVHTLCIVCNKLLPTQ